MGDDRKEITTWEEYREWLAFEYVERPGAEYPKRGSWVEKLSRALSAVMHPFFLPVYAMAVFMLADPVLAAAPTRLKLFFWAMIVLVALMIPAVSIALLRALRLISGFSIENRQDRTVPLAIVALSYGLCIIMVTDIMWGFIIRKFLIAAFCCAVCALAVTPFWKISLYMIAAGAVCGIFAVLAIAGINSVFVPLTVALLLSGMLASARLYLGTHTPAQVAAGFFLGLVVAAATMLFIK